MSLGQGTEDTADNHPLSLSIQLIANLKFFIPKLATYLLWTKNMNEHSINEQELVSWLDKGVS